MPEELKFSILLIFRGNLKGHVTFLKESSCIVLPNFIPTIFPCNPK